LCSHRRRHATGQLSRVGVYWALWLFYKSVLWHRRTPRSYLTIFSAGGECVRKTICLEEPVVVLRADPSTHHGTRTLDESRHVVFCCGSCKRCIDLLTCRQSSRLHASNNRSVLQTSISLPITASPCYLVF